MGISYLRAIGANMFVRLYKLRTKLSADLAPSGEAALDLKHALAPIARNVQLLYVSE